MKKQSKVMIGLGAFILIILILLIAFAPILTPYSPVLDNPAARLLAPSRAHIMGTDHFGRDIFTRILYGGRITLPLAFITIFLTFILGCSLGIVCAFNYKKFLDNAIMRIVDVLLALPFMVLAMSIAAIAGRGLDKLLFIVVLVWWAPFTRYTRSLVLTIKDQESILAAKILGANTFTIIFNEILPQVIFPLCIYLTFEFSNLILSLSTLSFFGLGAQPPTPEWGSMLSDGRSHFLYSAHVLIWPACFVVATVLGLNLLGEGLKDYYYPYELIPFYEEVSND